MKWQTPPSSRGCDAELVDKAFEIACILVGLGEATLSNLNPFFQLYSVHASVFLHLAVLPSTKSSSFFFIYWSCRYISYIYIYISLTCNYM